jgi:hypothetical protein
MAHEIVDFQVLILQHRPQLITITLYNTKVSTRMY